MAVIREYKEGDEIQLVDLLSKVFDRPVTLNDWIWKYKDNPAGNPIISVAEDEGRIVGFYGVIPFVFEVGEKRMVFYQVTDSAVHPQYRRGKVFSAMARMVIRATLQKDSGCNNAIMYGFPTKGVSSFGRRFLGYMPIGGISKFQRPLKADFLRKFVKNRYIFKLIKPAASLAIFSLDVFTKMPKRELVFEKIVFFPKEIDYFWDRISFQNKISIVRDSAFLNWRYVKKPAKDYEIFFIRKKGDLSGYVVLKCDKGDGIIVDFVLEDNWFFAEALCHILEYFRKMSMKRALFFTSFSACTKALGGLGFFRAHLSDSVLNIVDPSVYSPDVSWDIIKNIENWHINFSNLEL